MPGFGAERCFSEKGVLLFAQSHTRIEAVRVEEVEASDFELPFEIEAVIPRCFPREDPTATPTFDIRERVERRDFASALSTALLTAADLSCDWQETPAEFRGGRRECADSTNVQVMNTLASAESNLAQIRQFGDDSFPEMLLRHRLYFMGDEDPSVLLAALGDYYAACDGSSFENTEGEIITMNVQEVEVDIQVGESAIAFSLTYNHSAYPSWYVLTWRDGPLISSLTLGHFDAGPNPEFFRELNPGLLERFAANLDERVTNLAAKFTEASSGSE
jgi:hypothetical protein